MVRDLRTNTDAATTREQQANVAAINRLFVHGRNYTARTAVSYGDILIALSIAVLFLAVPTVAVLGSLISAAAGVGVGGLALFALYLAVPEFRRLANLLVVPTLFIGGSLLIAGYAIAIIASVFTYKFVTSVFDSIYSGLRTAIFPVRYLNEKIETRFIEQINAEPEATRNALAEAKNTTLNTILTGELAVAFGASQAFIATALYSALIPILGPGFALAGAITLSVVNISKLNGWREDRLNNFRVSSINREGRENWQEWDNQILSRIGIHWNNAIQRGLTPEVQSTNIRSLLQNLQNSYENGITGLFGFSIRNRLTALPVQFGYIYYGQRYCSS
jgi:hypothetical protein